VVHAAGVERVARRLAGAAAVEDAAVLAVPQERRSCTHVQKQRGSGRVRRATRDYEEKIATEGLLVQWSDSHVRLHACFLFCAGQIKARTQLKGEL
jgi:hypothetical protein